MGGFMLGIAVGVVVNLITALFSREKALKLLPWFGMYIIVHGTWAAISSDPIWSFAMDKARANPSWWSYAAVAVVTAILASLCWYSINTAVHKLDVATTHPTPQPPTIVTRAPLPPVSVPVIPKHEPAPLPPEPKKVEAPPVFSRDPHVVGWESPGTIPPGVEVPVIPSSSTYGNLGQRAITLSVEISTRLATHPIGGTTMEEILSRGNSAVAYFRLRYWDRLNQIHDEFAGHNLRDPTLERLLEKDHALKGLSTLDPILPQDLGAAAESLKALVNQIRPISQ